MRSPLIPDHQLPSRNRPQEPMAPDAPPADQPPRPQKSPLSFAVFWFAVPVILLIIMGLLGHRS